MSSLTVGAQKSGSSRFDRAHHGIRPPVYFIPDPCVTVRGRDQVRTARVDLFAHITSPTAADDAGPERPAELLIEEADAIHQAAGDRPVVHTSLLLAAWRGDEARALRLIEADIEETTAEHRGTAVCVTAYARSVLYNGLGRYQAAVVAARRSCQHENLGLFTWALAELVEAGARSGNLDVAAAALRRLEERAPAGGTDWALGIQARSRALLSHGSDADPHYRAAIERLASGRIPLHLARAQLVYGEWLRREGRRVDARRQLRAAHDMFRHVGAVGFTDRAGRELLATGETVRRRTVETRDQLTAQEAHVARLARDGHTNPEIGAQLFISPRTVEWHLRKVFAKLGISSRKELRGSLLEPGPTAVPA